MNEKQQRNYQRKPLVEPLDKLIPTHLHSCCAHRNRAIRNPVQSGRCVEYARAVRQRNRRDGDSESVSLDDHTGQRSVSDLEPGVLRGARSPQDGPNGAAREAGMDISVLNGATRSPLRRLRIVMR